MIKRNCLLISAIIGLVLIFLAACGSNTASDPEEHVNVSDVNSPKDNTSETETDVASIEEKSSGEEENTEQSEAQNGEKVESEERPDVEERPKLPETGGKLEDFVPEDWRIMDSVELDFNKDGYSDYVGVLEADIPKASYWGYPRILFAIGSDEIDGYHLEFQDINLIRTGNEGGFFDPYEPLTAEGTSFTTHAWGGSAWKWSEDYTYTYKEGIWYLTTSEIISYAPGDYGDYDYIIDHDDWERGVGTRKKRSSSWEELEKDWDAWVSAGYDIEYEIPLDEPLTIEQAGKRCWRASRRVTEWETTSITLGREVELSEDEVELPEDALMDYCDEDRVLYSFSNEEKDRFYLAEYRFEDKVLSVPIEEKTEIDDLKFYKGKIYYTTEIVENIKYRKTENGKEQIKEKEDAVGIMLNRMNPDGTEKETVFSYRYPKAEEIPQYGAPYISLIYEISGDEIVAEVYLGDNPHPFYRMKTDGSGLKKIGQVADDDL